ncbi:hypothetical protein [Micromonospora sp. NPDC050695]|uniref:DUF6907 domain-containing protein n=1 Tax=Micromonospora sp. NPDC050695 TaxID=3154938 RepID=UPI0033D5211E
MKTATVTCPPWCTTHHHAFGEDDLLWHRSATAHSPAEDSSGVTVWTELADDSSGERGTPDVVVQVDGEPYSILLTPARARMLAAQLLHAADHA